VPIYMICITKFCIDYLYIQYCIFQICAQYIVIDSFIQKILPFIKINVWDGKVNLFNITHILYITVHIEYIINDIVHVFMTCRRQGWFIYITKKGFYTLKKKDLWMSTDGSTSVMRKAYREINKLHNTDIQIKKYLDDVKGVEFVLCYTPKSTFLQMISVTSLILYPFFFSSLKGISKVFRKLHSTNRCSYLMGFQINVIMQCKD